jgi:glycosyltransferase involved in cell wall biosynthesis
MVEKTLRIAFIYPRFNLETGGGAHHSLHLVASNLAALGHDVMVIPLDAPVHEYPIGLPYTVIRDGWLSTRFDRGHRLGFQKVLRRYENQVDIYDIRHPNFILGGAIYRWSGGKVPVVAHLNNYDFCSNVQHIDTNCPWNCGVIKSTWHRPHNPARKAAMLPFCVFEHCLGKLLTNQADAFTAVSPAVAEIYLHHGISEGKTYIVPAGIDYEYLCKVKNNRTDRLFLAKSLYNILYVGRLSPEKGVDILIKSARMLEFPLCLHLVGDGPERTRLEQLSNEIGLSDKVVFHGQVPYDRVIDFYQSAQLFVHPVRWPEPLARTVLDAMAIGVPVIAADSGGSPWALQGTGLTFLPEDVDDLAEKIKLLHGNPELAVDLAEKAQKRARDFDTKNTIPRLLEVYRSVIARNTRKGHTRG